MNWKALSFDWNHMRAFLVTAETGSFSAAARALGMTQPTLGRQVAALEAELDLVLFERVGRSLVLTPAGQAVLIQLRPMGEAALRVSLAASGQSEAEGGRVSVSVTDFLALHIMPGLVARLRTVAPQIELEVIASNTISDLQRREADIAVRHVQPEAPDLIARKLRDEKAWIYGSRAYGQMTPEQVAQADFVSMGEAEELAPYLKMMGVPVERPTIVAKSEQGALVWEMARRGVGLSAMLEDAAALFPDMHNVCPELKPILIPYWLCVHRELHTSQRIRVVFDFLAATLGRRDFGLDQPSGGLA